MKNTKLYFAGFTLLELIVVLLLLSLALGMVAPRVSVGVKKLTERDFVINTIKLLNRARFRALSSGGESIFFIDGANRIMGIDSAEKEKIPENIDIYSKGLQQIANNVYAIRFFPDGSATATHLEITFNKGQQYFISINPFSGQLVFSENKKP